VQSLGLVGDRVGLKRNHRFVKVMHSSYNWSSCVREHSPFWWLLLSSRAMVRLVHPLPWVLNRRCEMSSVPTVVEKHIRLSEERANRLNRLAEIHQIREDQIIERALDILFTLTDLFDESTERQGWSFLSDAALQRVWDNEEDAVYDDWRALYDVPTR
jgi:hypothetical protein